MSIDIWVGDWDEPESVCVTAFHPYAYYAFLHPLIQQLESEHGHRIVLWGHCRIEPAQLSPVLDVIAEAEALVAEEGETFDVDVGRLSGELETVVRADFLRFIHSWRSAAELARERHQPLCFYGD